MTPTPARHRVLVLGAGYAGLFCVLRTAKRTRRHGGRVTLVNASSWFTERLRMHQVAAGQTLANLRILELLEGTGIVQGRVAGINADTRQVSVQAPGPGGEQVLAYDTLVYALGAVTDTGTVPGADHAFTLDDPRAAAALAARLTELGPLGGTVTVCGGADWMTTEAAHHGCRANNDLQKIS